MKRVLIFSLAYYPHVGGAEVAVKEITDRLSDIEFHMVTLRFSRSDAAEEKVGNVVAHRIGGGVSYFSKILFIPRAAFAARRLHSQQKFDVLWAMMSYMLFPLVFSRLLGIRAPYFLTLEEGDPFEHMFKRARIRPVLPLLSWGFTPATVVHAESTFLGGWARSWGYKGPLEVIHNGVDAARFASAESIEVGKKSGEIWLIHTGRLVHKNALDVVIRAMPLMPQQVHLYLLGEGPDKTMLVDLAQKLKVSDRVHFHPYVHINEVPRYLTACDIFIRPSRSEGMGNSFIEAMAAGLPVIATQEGGIADFLFDAKRNPGLQPTGFAVDKNAPQQIAEAVEYILRNPAQVQKVIENAQKLVFEKYDWDLIAADMREEVFGRVFKN